MKIKAFNILNQNGKPSANQIEIIVHNENTITNIFQSYNCIISKIIYNTECDNTLIIDKRAYEHSVTTSKYLNMWMDNNGIDPKEVKIIEKIKMLDYDELVIEMGNNSRKRLEDRFAPKTHYNALLNI